MENEPGDDYIRRTASYIRTHEQGLAAAALPRRRRAKVASEPSYLNPLGWFGTDSTAPSTAKPVILTFDFHHLFYLLMRLEALGIDIGSLDVRTDTPSRPMNYINIFPGSDKSDALSLLSFRSSLSAVSRLSLGAGWWGRAPPPNVDAELKYIFSCFTKLPALRLHAPEAKLIAELANESPNENALPLDAFKSLETLQCINIDPRTLLGWDRLAESLRSLSIKNSGMEDVSDIFIAAVIDDEARRKGRVNDTRTRVVSRGLSRATSFHSTRLPDSVPEDEEEDSDTPPPSSVEDKATSPRPAELSSLKWAFLRHLSLADNALTFLPTTPLPFLTSLTHLDLSSNLLISIPPGLSSLYNLISLNLSDNMIESVLGIYTVLGQILHLNLSHNRLESICGLERLLALERVDLRHNVMEESAEVGRLATLPNIAEVWVEGNPFIDLEEGYRIRCFDYFWKEGKSILLDGTPPGFYEKMYLTTAPPQQMTSARPPSVAYSPPVVAVGSPRLTNGSSPATSSPRQGPSSPSSLPSHAPSPQIAPVLGRGRRRKNKRIVDLDGGDASEAGSSRSASHTPMASDVRPTSPKRAGKEPAAVSGLRSPVTPAANEPIATGSSSAATLQVRPVPRSRHSRHVTEFVPSNRDISDEVTPGESASVHTGSLRRSATMSKSTARRSRISASMYQPPSESRDAEDQLKEAEAFRARIEALRSDMGEGWLKVFNQSQLGSSGVTSG